MDIDKIIININKMNRVFILILQEVISYNNIYWQIVIFFMKNKLNKGKYKTILVKNINNEI